MRERVARSTMSAIVVSGRAAEERYTKQTIREASGVIQFHAILQRGTALVGYVSAIFDYVPTESTVANGAPCFPRFLPCECET